MKNLILIVLLAIVAGVSFLLVRNLEKDLKIVAEQKPTREIATGYQVSAHYFDANKQLKYLITSDSVTEYSNRAGARFQQPKVDVFNNSVLQWTATAKKGFLSSDKNKLTISDDVLFVDDPKGEKPLSIYGSVMYYHAPTNTISSNQSSVISDGVIRQVSEQFSLNTVSKVIDFSESIKSHYKTTTD